MHTVPTRPQHAAAAIATFAEHRFAVTRIEHGDQSDSTGDFVAYHLELDPPGEVEVVRSGFDGRGPWGVDLYRPSDGHVLPVEEARRWAHAILAAADLAEQLEHAELEQPC